MSKSPTARRRRGLRVGQCRSYCSRVQSTRPNNQEGVVESSFKPVQPFVTPVRLHGNLEAVNEESGYKRESWRLGKYPGPGRGEGILNLIHGH
jgi:hypothetical protein